MARATTTRGGKKSVPAKAVRTPARRGTAAPKAPPAPKLSKDELRAQVEKLEKTVASLRLKNRELKRVSGAEAGRVEELERMVAKLERKLALQETPAAETKPRRNYTRRRKSGDIDPGDAVPPGVAVDEPEPLTDEDKKVLAHMNETLAPD